MAPVKEGRLAVQWQSSLLLVQKASKCWMHTVSTAVSMFGEQWERQVGARARIERVDKQTPMRQALPTSTTPAEVSREKRV
jgi:hypothetical protein